MTYVCTAWQYMLLYMYLVLAVNSDWFQILRSYTLLLKLPILNSRVASNNGGKLLTVWCL